MTKERVFTLEEVNELIPKLSRVVGDLLHEQSEIEQRLARLSGLVGSRPSLTPCVDDSPQISTLKHELRERIHRFEAGWNGVEQLGGVVKDPRIGLVDFYGHVGGRLVWLCWRYGESAVRSYHALDAGYSARRELDERDTQSLLN